MSIAIVRKSLKYKHTLYKPTTITTWRSGQVYETLTYNRTLSVEEINHVTNYLRERYGGGITVGINITQPIPLVRTPDDGIYITS